MEEWPTSFAKLTVIEKGIEILSKQLESLIFEPSDYFTRTLDQHAI